MNKALLSLAGCSGSIIAILATGTLASPDTAKTIPYPEVMNLRRAPKFDYKGIIPQTAIAKGSNKQYEVQKVVDFQNKTPEEVAIEKFGCDCPGCKTRARDLMGLSAKG